MTEKAVLAVEEALLAALFTQRALSELLIKKGIITRKELKNAALKTESYNIGAGEENERLFLEKRKHKKRREKNKRVKKDRRRSADRRAQI